MQEVKKLEDLNIPVSQSTSHIAETVVSSIHETEAPLYIEFSNKNKKDLKETFRNVVFKNPKEGRYAKIFNNYAINITILEFRRPFTPPIAPFAPAINITILEFRRT